MMIEGTDSILAVSAGEGAATEGGSQEIVEGTYDRATRAVYDRCASLGEAAGAMLERDEIPGEEVLSLLDREP